MLRNKFFVPDFYLIGAMKAGTTSLYWDLGAHPSVAFTFDKEPNVLASPAPCLQAYLEEYSVQFPHARKTSICGDASTAYSKWPTYKGVPELAAMVSGEQAKVLYSVRDPVERAVSHYRHLCENEGLEVSFDAAVEHVPEIIAYSRYSKQIEPWLEVFGEDNVRLINFEEYKASRLVVINRILQFLEAPSYSGFKPSLKVYNKAGMHPLPKGFFFSLTKNKVYRRFIRRIINPRARERLRTALLPSGRSLHIVISQDLLEEVRRDLAGEAPDELSDRFSFV